MRTRIDMASCAAGPRSPFSMARSDSVRVSVTTFFHLRRAPPPPRPVADPSPRIYSPRLGMAAGALTIIRHMRKTCAALAVASFLAVLPTAQTPAPAQVVVLKPARVFDGDTMHEGWAVRIKGEKIDAVGPAAGVASADARVVDLAGATLTPGLMEGHSHVLLHAYNEASWIDQVSKEGLALRVARAVNHLRSTLLAGFTTIRDLGTEGAGYADVELKQAVSQGIVPGPRILASTRAIVATGSYQPKFIPEWNVPQGAEEADGVDSLTRVVRDQIGRGADWIKLYADYRWGPQSGS